MRDLLAPTAASTATRVILDNMAAGYGAVGSFNVRAKAVRSRGGNKVE